MKLKSSIRLQLSEFKRPLSIFYFIMLIMLLFMAFSIVTIINRGGHATIGGLESGSMIFIFVCGLNSFLSPFRISMANGVSRKTMFVSHLISFASISVFMAAVDTLYAFAATSFVPYRSTFYQIYGSHFTARPVEGIVHSPLFLLQSFLWSVCIYLMCVALGYLISSLYYRMNKAMKLVVSIGVPGLIMIVLPYVDMNYGGGRITRSIIDFIGYITGITADFNPYICMASGLVLFVIFSGFAFLLVRKATVRQ